MIKSDNDTDSVTLKVVYENDVNNILYLKFMNNKVKEHLLLCCPVFGVVYVLIEILKIGI